VLAPGGRLQRVLRMTIDGDRISRVEIIADPATLQGIQLGALP